MPKSQRSRRVAWNRGKIVGQKPPLKIKEVWAMRVRLQLAERSRDLALFNMAIDSKLRGCDVVKVRDHRTDPVGYTELALPARWPSTRATISKSREPEEKHFDPAICPTGR